MVLNTHFLNDQTRVVCKGKTPVKFEDFWIGNLGKVGPQVTAFMDWMRGIEEVEMEDFLTFSC